MSLLQTPRVLLGAPPGAPSGAQSGGPLSILCSVLAIIAAIVTIARGARRMRQDKPERPDDLLTLVRPHLLTDISTEDVLRIQKEKQHYESAREQQRKGHTSDLGCFIGFLGLGLFDRMLKIDEAVLFATLGIYVVFLVLFDPAVRARMGGAVRGWSVNWGLLSMKLLSLAFFVAAAILLLHGLGVLSAEVLGAILVICCLVWYGVWALVRRAVEQPPIWPLIWPPRRF